MQAEAAVKTSLLLNKSLWLAHLVNGALHCCRFKWKDAATAFDRALEIAPAEVRSHFWYIAFLLAMGKTAEADKCITTRQIAIANPFLDGRIWLIQAASLYIQRQFEAAHSCISLSLPGNFRDLSTYGGLFGMRATDKTVEFQDWLTEALLICAYLGLKRYELASQYAMAFNEKNAGRGLGLVCIAVIAGGKPELVEGIPPLVAEMEEDAPSYSRVDLALAYMSIENHEQASEMLSLACDEGHPLMAWLHILPIFDSLKELQAFRALVERTRPPLA